MQNLATSPLASLLGLLAWLSLGPTLVEAQTAPADGAPSVGLRERVAWTTSRLVGTPDPPPPYQAERAFGELAYKNPVELVSLSGSGAAGGERLFIVELQGKIYSFPNTPDAGDVEPALFFDMKASIAGMKMAYGLAFHPDFATNRYCYICYVLDAGLPDGTRVSRFEVEPGDPPRIKPESEQILLTFRSGGHNGGCLRFGPDGCLYISTGDAESPFPPDRLATGQDVSDLLSSILRVDVDHPSADKPYSIPPDNPFVSLAGARGEVWAYGLRNPWKMSFDLATGELWVGDVGWELLEMVYRIERGGNYGWAVMEGSQPVLTEGKRGPTPILPPVVEHSHTEARSITGGYAYHGRRLPELANCYLYGDYETGKIWALRYEAGQVKRHEELVDTTLKIICFAEDRDGELYVVDYQGGLYRLVPNSQREANEQFPRRLSETGLFSAVESLSPAPGVVPYSISAEPWADHAVAQRHVALPGLSHVDTTSTPWKFPPGAVLAKTISLPLDREQPGMATRLETQVLHFDGRDWRGYTYAWNDEQTDADLVDAPGADRTFSIRDPQAPGGGRRQTWRFASRAQCVLCHNTMAGSVLGFTAVQLNKRHFYAGSEDEQLHALMQAKILSGPFAANAPKMVDPLESRRDLNQRARSYLHANCSHCHRRHGGGTAAIELLYELPLESTRAINARPTQGTFGIHGAKVITPGDPYRSVLYYRMAKLGRGRMPHLGSELVHVRGLALIHEWIKQLAVDADKPVDQAPAVSDEVERLLAALPRDKTSAKDAVAVADPLLPSPREALELVRALDQQSLSAAVRERVIERGVRHADPQISGLFERFAPDALRPQRLGAVIRPEQITSLAGDAAAGRKLFFEAAAVQCKSCHRIGGKGIDLGPDLSQIGKKYDRAQLLESLLEPSKKVDPKFAAWLVETAAGQVYSGLLVERNEREVVLKDNQNKTIRVPLEETELVVPQQKSLMPELLLRDMTAQEAADLLEFLASLKGT